MVITRLTPHFAAQIDGVDITRPLDEPAWKGIRAALDEHSVLVFRGQPLEALEGPLENAVDRSPHGARVLVGGEDDAHAGHRPSGSAEAEPGGEARRHPVSPRTVILSISRPRQMALQKRSRPVGPVADGAVSPAGLEWNP